MNKLASNSACVTFNKVGAHQKVALFKALPVDADFGISPKEWKGVLPDSFFTKGRQ
jgi:hypothetical protein